MAAKGVSPAPSVDCTPSPGDSEVDDEDLALDLGENPLDDKDQLLHYWCVKQLGRCLRRLQRLPSASLFLQPLPYKDLGLEDFLEKIENPIDLETIGKRLQDGQYEDDDGLILPREFWDDIFLCWENWKRYYDNDHEAEAYRMAEDMSEHAWAMEERFGADLDRFGNSLDGLGGSLGSVATMAAVAASNLEDAAQAAYEDSGVLYSKLANWWYGPQETELARASVVSTGLVRGLESRQALQDFYIRLLDKIYHVDAQKDVHDIEEEIDDGFSDLLLVHEEVNEEYAATEAEEEMNFEGAVKKIPISKLVPAKRPAGKLLSASRASRSCHSSRASSISSAISVASCAPDGMAGTPRNPRGSSRGSERSSGTVRSRVSQVASLRGGSRRTPRCSTTSLQAALAQANCSSDPSAGQQAAVINELLHESSSEAETAPTQVNLDNLRDILRKKPESPSRRAPPAVTSTPRF